MSIAFSNKDFAWFFFNKRKNKSFSIKRENKKLTTEGFRLK